MTQNVFRNMTVAETLATAFALYRQHFSYLMGLIITPAFLTVLMGLMVLFAPASSLMGLFAILLVLLMIFDFVVTVAMVHALAGSVAGRLPGMSEAFRLVSIRSVVSIIIFTLIGWLLVGLGLLMFVLPGLILMGLLLPAIPAIVLERLNPIQGLERTYQLMKGALVKGILLVLFSLLLWLPLLVAESLSTALSWLLYWLIFPFLVSIEVVLYLSMRSAEGYTVAGLQTDLTPVMQRQQPSSS